ncbi:MAG: sulfatase [Phycisphaerae bacterium]|jgi:arylsulfatase A-like enzyme|nr:sulfatase [Phycisphaerae bacterium]
MLSRREFLAGTLTGATAAITASSFAAESPASKGKRPNIVWLMSEDNSKHYMKLFDENGAETPRIAAMAKSGVLFTRAFSNCPVCSAARSILATGCYGSRIGTQFHRKFKTVPMPDGLAPIGTLMKQAGYYTSNVRKTDYNFSYKGKIWDSGKDWRGRKPGQPFFHKQQFGVTHESGLHRANKGGTDEKMFVAPCHPDTPLFRQANKAYKELHAKMDAQIGAVVDQLKKDGVLEDTFVFYFGDHGGVLPGSKGYVYETGLHVPLVVRIPENFKHLVDLKPDSSVGGFVSFIDFAPTALNLAGAKIPSQMDGKPFMGPGVKCDEVNKRDETFGMADRFDEKYDFVRTLRKGKYKYMRSYQPFNFDGLWNNYRYIMASYKEWWKLYKGGKLTKEAALFFEPRAPEALYDIDKDPYEVNNIASDPANAKVLADMRTRLQARVKGMPDLSFFPESELVKKAWGNPVKFGQDQKARIATLVDIADLSLIGLDKAKDKITAALESKDPWARYWGLIVCSCFGKQAESFVAKAKSLANADAEPLVRVRAAEFLALTGAAAPQKVIMDVLATAEHPLEAVLTLNTVVLLRDGKPGYKFDITADSVKAKCGDVSRRLQYLTGKGGKPKKKRRKK